MLIYVSAYQQCFIIVLGIDMEIDNIEIDVKITVCGDKIEEKIIYLKIRCGWYLDRHVTSTVWDKDQSVNIMHFLRGLMYSELEVTF